MSGSLSGMTAVVVGASSGMGRATARALSEAGAHVVAAARRTDRLTALGAELQGGDGQLQAARVDVASRASVERLIADAREVLGRIDVLVYAAGTNIPRRSLDQLSPSDWDLLLATNLTGAFHCTQSVLPLMRAAGGGLIIYLSTGAVQMPDVSGVAYQASKHGLSGLAHGTRVEEKAHGIRTSLIFPGLCDTEILTKRPQPTPPEVLAKALRPEDVAEAVLFLCRLPARAVVPELQLLPSGL